MDVFQQRIDRFLELQEIRRTAPADLIMLYRRTVGLGQLDSLPPELSVPRLIQAIIDKEMPTQPWSSAS